MIKYDFKGNYKSTIAEKIHVGFTTTDPKGFLIGAYSVIRWAETYSHNATMFFLL